MIRFRHALLLARTKLKSKRALLSISVGVSSLLFAALIAGIIVFTGGEKSASHFISKANDGVYRVQVDPVIPSSLYSYATPLSMEEINRIRAVEKQYYTELKAKYAAINLKYDTVSEVPALKPSPFFSESTPFEQRFMADFSSPVISYDQNKKMEAYIEIANNKSSDLAQLSRKYDVVDIRKIDTHLATLGRPTMRFIENGIEDFSKNDFRAPGSTPFAYQTNAVYNGTYMPINQELIQRYMLPRNEQTPLKGIPVVITAQEAAKLFGKGTSLENEPHNQQEKMKWLQQIQSKFNAQTYQSCYRNSAEIKLLEKIQRDYADITNNKNNASFVEPRLQYETPTTACGSITVKKDSRTAVEKKADSDLVETQKKLGTYIEPYHSLLTFEVVGIIHAKPFTQYDADVQSYLQNLLVNETTAMSAYIPQQLYDTLPSAMKMPLAVSEANNAVTTEKQKSAGLVTHVLDFKTVESAREFMNTETCPSSSTNCPKLYTSSPYGSNFLILDEIGKLFNKGLSYVLPIVLGIAALIMWFTMARVMYENRKETAVYRALGAKRRDVMSIYVTYTLLITLRIAVLSLIGGVAIAYLTNYMYAPQLTATALVSFGTATDGMTFELLDFSSPLMYLVVVSIFVISFIAILPPLIRNVRRNPIQDMRNE